MLGQGRKRRDGQIKQVDADLQGEEESSQQTQQVQAKGMWLKTNVSTWVLVSEPGFFKVLAHFPGNRILLPEMKPRNNIVF